MPENGIFKLKNINLKDNGKTLFSGLNFSVDAGEVHAVVSTQVFLLDKFLNILCGRPPYPTGTVEYMDREYSAHTAFCKKGIKLTYVTQESMLYDDFSVMDNIFFSKRFSFGFNAAKNRALLTDLIESFGMEMDVDQKIYNLSYEERKIVELLAFCMNDERLAVFYETVLRLSIDSIFKLMRFIDVYKSKGKSVIFITSSVDDALKISDRVSILGQSGISNTFSSKEIRKNPQKIFYLLSGWTHINDVKADNYLETFESLIKIRDFSFSTYELSSVLQALSQNIKHFMQARICNIYINYDGDIIKISSDSAEKSFDLERNFINNFKKYNGEQLFINCSDAEYSDAFESRNTAKTMVCTPIVLESESAGVLQICYDKTYRPTRKEAMVLSSLNKEISIAIETSRLLGRSTLLQESHHRIKNNLQTIINLLYMQEAVLKNSTEVDFSKVIDAIVTRIKSIALVHDLITNQNSSGTVMFGDVIKKILKIYDFENIKFHVDAEGISLPYANATSLALLLNELISNCTKHAFENVQKKEINISCNTAGDSICLTVSDNGRGLPEGFSIDTAKSVGMSIIKSMVSEFKGSIEFKSAKGTSVKIIIPKESFSIINRFKLNKKSS